MLTRITFIAALYATAYAGALAGSLLLNAPSAHPYDDDASICEVTL